MYTVDSPEVQRFLVAWHENERSSFERRYKSLDYDSYAPKTAHDRRKYIALDRGNSGVLLMDKATGICYTIHGYGQRGRWTMGHITKLTEEYEIATEYNRYAENFRLQGMKPQHLEEWKANRARHIQEEATTVLPQGMID